MKQLSSSLREFIREFQLDKYEGSVCFDAVIYFTTSSRSFQMPTEVHIVTIGQKNMDVVYLLHPDVAKLGIPDMYEEGPSVFINVPGKALVIKGHSSAHGKYTLSIHPKNGDCNEATLAEIYGKTFN